MVLLVVVVFVVFVEALKGFLMAIARLEIGSVVNRLTTFR